MGVWCGGGGSRLDFVPCRMRNFVTSPKNVARLENPVLGTAPQARTQGRVRPRLAEGRQRSAAGAVQLGAGDSPSNATQPPVTIPLPVTVPVSPSPPLGHRAGTPWGNLTLSCARTGWQQAQQPQVANKFKHQNVDAHRHHGEKKRIPISTNSHLQFQSPSVRDSEEFPFLAVHVSQKGTGDVAGSG